MFQADKIEGTIELKNFMSDMKSRPEGEFARYVRERFDDFIDLCKKAGLKKDKLAFYTCSEPHKSKRRIEFDEYFNVCRIISLADNGSSVTSDAWEASMFLLLLMSICRHRRILYLPWTDIISFLYPTPDEHTWTPLMKFIRNLEIG